ncbi:MAG: hypothetical protein A2889_01060 [Nitrospinae bacterium RIFCSPLOWO2_01_FULL_39_10]|nr:MAG: hypothetical protein A2889_01060 [Nitrospinae bacterium RIFCSPLOWO2_01_FULL_39_10]
MKEGKQKTWWPHHVLKAGSFAIITLIVVVILAIKFQIPDDAPAIVPMADDGQYIPGPEWYFLFLWQPFWYFTGGYKHLLSYAVIIPAIFILFLILLPFIRIPFLSRKGVSNPENVAIKPMGIFRKLVFNAPVLIAAVFLAFITFKSGYQAKLYGCDACHNSAMGVRMGLPPVNVVEYYKVDRAGQIGSGKYKAGKVVSIDEITGKKTYDLAGTESYKDANWQMRHMYEPTFTW